MSAEIDLSAVKPLPLFSYIKTVGNIEDDEMLSTFNCGVGLIVVVSKECCEKVKQQISRYFECYTVGKIVSGDRKITLRNQIAWK